jgi:hypothetical protein
MPTFDPATDRHPLGGSPASSTSDGQRPPSPPPTTPPPTRHWRIWYLMVADASGLREES